MYNHLVKFRGVLKYIFNILEDDILFQPHLRSTNKLVLRVPYKKRKYYLEKLAEHKDCIYDSSTADSHLGRIDYKGLKIVIKPLKYSTSGPGIKNELFLYNIIQNYIRVHRGINIIFYTDTKQSIFKYIDGVIHTKNTNNNYSKSDIILTSGGEGIGNISIKQDNFNKWESLHQRCRDVRDKFIEKTLSGELNIILKQRDKYTNKYFMYDAYTHRKITQVIINDIPDINIHEIVFGKDIPHTTVIRRTFQGKDFSFSNNTLFIRVSSIYNTPDDIKSPIVPVFKHHVGKSYGIELSARNKVVANKNTRVFNYDEIN